MTYPLSALDRLRAALSLQYDVERLLGQGGMGAVYLGRDLTLQRPVAIKVVSAEAAAGSLLRDRFLQEARVVAMLRHPNIVTVYSAGEADGQLYFVMEYVPGESLRDLLQREQRLPAAEAERVLRELALALDYAHAQGVVHRDVKPENILLDRETGRAMLTDFGIARAFEGSGNMTGTGMVLGSPRYMSPEQAAGERTLDGRSDLYSLALVGHEMVTGRSVIEATNPAAMLVKHLTEAPPPMAEAAPEVSAGYAMAVDHGLAKDPDQRWRTGREMAESIGNMTPPAGVTPPGGVAGAMARPPRRRLRAVALAAIMLVVAATGGLMWWRARPTASRLAYVVVPFEVQSGNRDVQWLREGAVNMLTLALAQWRDLQVTDYERTLDLVKDAGVGDGRRVTLEQARAVARKAGAGSLVMGQVSTTTDSLVVVARLYDANSGRLLNDATRAAALAADPRATFDQLARHLLNVAGGSSASLVDLSKATTTSLQAYQEYLDGIKALNGWRLEAADSLFASAIARDSTFALAYHKRALTRGWSDIAGTEYRTSAERAMQLADRLPPRERAMVDGHGHLVRGMDAERRGDSSAVGEFSQAIAIYERLTSDAPSLAEAWYGLGDARWHGRQHFPFARQPGLVSGARAAFLRALEVDPEQHLAYSHLIDIYLGLARGYYGLALAGDSIVDAAALRTDRERTAGRDRAFARGIELARAWQRADPGAQQPYQQLAQVYGASNQPDSAARVLREGATRIADGSGAFFPILAVVYDFLAGSPGTHDKLATAIAAAHPDVLRQRPMQARYETFGLAMSLAAATGDSRLLQKTVALWLRVDSLVPGTTAPLAPYLDFYTAILRSSLGEPITAAQQRTMLETLWRIERGTGVTLGFVRFKSAASAYQLFLATGDTAAATLARRLSTNGDFPELDAARALATGDTSTARRLARDFPPPDTVRVRNLGLAGMRTVTRAAVLEALGQPRLAVENLDAMSPLRFSLDNSVEPGLPLYVRSFVDRARLYERLGDRAKAAESYRKFLTLWGSDDPLTARQRRAAREALARLGDAPR